MCSQNGWPGLLVQKVSNTWQFVVEWNNPHGRLGWPLICPSSEDPVIFFSHSAEWAFHKFNKKTTTTNRGRKEEKTKHGFRTTKRIEMKSETFLALCVCVCVFYVWISRGLGESLTQPLKTLGHLQLSSSLLNLAILTPLLPSACLTPFYALSLRLDCLAPRPWPDC